MTSFALKCPLVYVEGDGATEVLSEAVQAILVVWV